MNLNVVPSPARPSGIAPPPKISRYHKYLSHYRNLPWLNDLFINSCDTTGNGVRVPLRDNFDDKKIYPWWLDSK